MNPFYPIHDPHAKVIKLILSLTIFDEDLNIHSFLSGFQQQTGYKRLKQTSGVHRDAKRIHRHIMIIYCVMGHKIYKTLNKKCHAIWKSLFWDNDNTDFKVTFTYNNDGPKSNPKNKYDQTCMMYPFKEYICDTDIEYGMQSGYMRDELHDMRKIANKKWKALCEAKYKEQQEKLEKDNKKQQMYQYLKQHTQYMKTSSIPHTRKIRESVLLILEYKKKVDESFRIHDLKNVAVNFLYKHSLISEFDIVEIINM